MDEILKKLKEQEVKIDAMYKSVEKLRKYFLWTLAITVATVVLPLVILAVALPFVFGAISSAYSGLL